jgi:hypothetical protein
MSYFEEDNEKWYEGFPPLAYCMALVILILIILLLTGHK